MMTDPRTAAEPDAARELTENEVRSMLLGHIHDLVSYWEGQEGSVKDRMDDLVFSILTTLDGDSLNFPKFIVAPDPHLTDREYLRSMGSGWFPENHKIAPKIKCDLGGSLHEFWHNRLD